MQRLEIRDFTQWRAAARPLLASAVAPDEIIWSDWRTPTLGQPGAGAGAGAGDAGGAGGAAVAGRVAAVGGAGAPGAAASNGAGATTAVAAKAVAGLTLTISPRLLSLLEALACYRDAARWELMYRITWRVMNEGRWLLDNDADPDVCIARGWEKAIHQDVHKMEAFVRFHETALPDGAKLYVAWFEPSHEILRRAAPFFERRFPNMQWLIATPDGAAVWTGARTDFIESPRRDTLARTDSTHSLWRLYYRNVCNVARISPETMQRHMPQRYWQHLPEASEIPVLIAHGRAIAQRSLENEPVGDDLRLPQAVKQALRQIGPSGDSPLSCRQCDLWRHATQAVMGEGPPDAALMLVGEQPGDQEDILGRPFVGPAGQLLDQALLKCGLKRSQLYLTNSVKHFKWEPRGKRRLHKRPNTQEVTACGNWLANEIATVAPTVIVALGSTAIRAVSGSSARVEDARQQLQRHSSGAHIVSTYHPAAILRAQGAQQIALLEALEFDLKHAASLIYNVSA